MGTRLLKQAFFLFLATTALGSAFAATPGQRDWWYDFERGRLMFAQGDYGNALLAFEDARRSRASSYAQMERSLVEILSSGEFRRLGDSLDLVEQRLNERNFTDALDIFRELYFYVPRETFNNSVNAALEALGTLAYFPEAEMWIGKVFFAGGEHGLALKQFELALSRRHLFDNPALATELLYQIAEVRRLDLEFVEMERVLVSILEDSSLWEGKDEGWQAGTFVRQAMLRTLESAGLERFLSLYRYGNTGTLQAHLRLGMYYAETGRYARAQEHLMFAFLIQSTAIIGEIIHGDFAFSFSTMAGFADRIASNRALARYAEDTEYYRTLFFLADALFGNGNVERARELWTFLGTRPEAGIWRSRSALQLRSPQLAPALVMP